MKMSEVQDPVEVVVEISPGTPSQLGFDVGEVEFEVFARKLNHPGLQEPSSSKEAGEGAQEMGADHGESGRHPKEGDSLSVENLARQAVDIRVGDRSFLADQKAMRTDLACELFDGAEKGIDGFADMHIGQSPVDGAGVHIFFDRAASDQLDLIEEGHQFAKI